MLSPPRTNSYVPFFIDLCHQKGTRVEMFLLGCPIFIMNQKK